MIRSSEEREFNEPSIVVCRLNQSGIYERRTAVARYTKNFSVVSVLCSQAERILEKSGKWW